MGSTRRRGQGKEVKVNSDTVTSKSRSALSDGCNDDEDDVENNSGDGDEA